MKWIKERLSPESNSGPMADIAFLLLVFFLLVTTLEVDQGITSQLSKPIKQHEKIGIHETRLWLNHGGELMLNGEIVPFSSLNDLLVQEYVQQEGIKNVLMLSCESEVDYNYFLQTLDAVKNSFEVFHNELAQNLYGGTLKELQREDQEYVKGHYPIALAENVLD